MKTLITIFLILLSHLLLAQSNVVDSLQKIVSLQRHDTTEVNALVSLAYEFLQKDLGKVKSYAYQVVTLSRSINAVPQLGNGYFYLISSHQNNGNLDSAVYYLDLLGKHSKANPTYWKMAANYNQAAGLFYKNTGQPKTALSYMLKNLEFKQLSGESRAGLMLNIGNIYFDLGDYRNSSSYYIRSLALFEKIGNKRGQSYILNSLGSTSVNMKQYAAAKSYLEKSLKIKEELNDSRGMVSSSNSLGDVYKELGQFNEAERYYLKALKASREVKIPLGEARSLHQLGLLYKRTGEYSRAKEDLKQSLILAKNGGDSLMSAKINSEIISIEMKEEERNLTESTLLTNLNTIIHAGDKHAQVVEYKRLSEFYAINGQFDKAYTFLKKYESLNDSVNGNSVVLQLKELEEKYNSEKKEKEITLLKQKQDLKDVEIKRQRANQTGIGIALISVILISLLLINRYRIVNRTKRQLELEHMRQGIARDLHDDIGSTLSSINIMSQLALNESDEATHQLKKIVTQSAHMMETMSDIVWSINPGNDSVEQMIHKMKEFAGEMLEPKNMEYHFEVAADANTILLSAEKRKNLYLIFKEAINNAAKYSEGNRVDILLNRENGSLHMTVRDNGKGFDSPLTKSGNGLNNMQARAAALQGTLTRNSKAHAGTEIILQIPIT